MRYGRWFMAGGLVYLMAAVTAVADTVVVFPDAALEREIRNTIHKPTGDIFDTDLLGVTYLGKTYGIENLTGLEYCINLKILGLDLNEISDLSALAGLTNLNWLLLSGNQISDLSALAGLTNLTQLSLRACFKSVFWFSGGPIGDSSSLS